ncbi:chemotaxis protein CheC [Tissierella praeacuta]|uniref:Chemotaxis protein CheC n=2 Tax=Tissierella praeacuta TaxID=43131 RepID=A0A1M4SJV2_9FIRM|nr:chemotaxis protein CheC [Tissierella praeacuta]MBU5254779.1 chemotaxis protein CheC [Tissierella praeacuta]TCU72677.1 chemotaxis protein CheC [Tissierella praeacuta]SHE32544.1 chemotaxis protein CheC [Tissierella praeacuta DSM 18095]SUP01505.1 CheY-P phosphatase CheC [Tissierella praeacuta]
MTINVDNLNNFMIDILKELGNIGAGNAATALASMISRKIDMKVPNVRIMEFKDVAEILGGEENLVIGIYFELMEDVVGNMMFALDIDSAINLTNILYNRKKENKELDEMDISALSEVGNIIASSYANSLSALTGLKVFISIPSISIDMAGAILSVPAIQYGHVSDHALMIETIFEEEENLVAGNLFFLPDLSSFDKILMALGVK